MTKANDGLGGLVLEQYDDYDWKKLPQWVREAAEGIGYSKKLWDKDKEPEICENDWEELTESQKESAKRLGYTKQLWDDEDNSSSESSSKEEDDQPLVLDRYEDSDWKDLPQWVREAAEGIGYTKKLWNKDKEPEICRKDWKDLTGSQQEAATTLGYTSSVWDAEGCDSMSICSCEPAATKVQTESPPGVAIRLEDVHKNTKWTIFCVQLYTETEDYQFRMKENMGVSMYANRPFSANEFIFQSPVGPCVHEGLFEMSPGLGGVLPQKRRDFAERFLEWQQSYGKTNRIGAMNEQVTFKMEDFSNPSITPKRHRMLPGPKFCGYDLEIFEHETLIVEFVPPPSNPDHELPPERRFEILHYGEGLVGLSGEEGYDPHKMKRPPTLCGLEARSLEIPGHFSNHASGATSTCYDFVSLGGNGAIDFSSAVSPDDLPDFLRNELDARKKAKETDSYEHLTARRAMELGTELTTDYSRWNWSCADWGYHCKSRKTPVGFFLGSPGGGDRWDWDDLSPKIQRAARILGYTKELWISEEFPSTFHTSWKKLTLQEREAAMDLTGYTEESWDLRSGFEIVDDDDFMPATSPEELDWKELTEFQREAALTCGFTKKKWNKGADVEEGSFFTLRPEVRDAWVVLGQTEATWEEEDDDEPWFECLCGDSECHSSKERGGFRGVKYFTLEEQLQVAMLCEPWVQQQLQWTLYKLEQENRANISDEKKE